MFASDASQERIDKALGLLDGFMFDKEQMNALSIKMRSLDGISDARKVRLILSMLSESWDDGSVTFSEYLKKFTLKKREGFELDMVMNLQELGASGIDANHADFKRYRTIGNFALVNGQLAHYNNKSARAKGGLYSNDKNVLTIGLSGLPCPPNYEYDLLNLRNTYDFSVDDWNLENIEARTVILVDEFLGMFPDCMIVTSKVHE